MGQRIQIIFKVPEYYLNEDNPNNRGEQVLVFHNQWLFGGNFLKYTQRIIETLEKKMKMHDQESKYQINYKKLVTDTIDYCNIADLSYPTRSQPLFSSRYGSSDREENNNKQLLKATDVLDFLEFYDNNNGYIFIHIKEDHTVEYDILNGYEDAGEIQSRTPKEYLNFFYSDAKLIEAGAWEFVKPIEYLNEETKQTYAFDVLREFKTKLSVNTIEEDF